MSNSSKVIRWGFANGGNASLFDYNEIIFTPGNYAINCGVISNSVESFIPETINLSGRAGTLFFPDNSLINTNCPVLSELSSFIPSTLESSGRVGTLFFPDFETKLCVT